MERARASSGWEEERAYMRALVVRYMELEWEHEALFPAMATFLKLSREEVGAIRSAQQRHAEASSLWGKTKSVSATLWGAATEVAAEVGKYGGPQGGAPTQRQRHGGAAAGTGG
jgi:hypothetical protein